jgi:ribokinase
MTNKALDVVAMGACYVDINVDNFPFTRDNLLSEELIGERYETVPGGSAVNFCRLSTQLGLQTALIGMAGDDASGDLLVRLLKEQGVQPVLIRRPDLQTNLGFNLTNPAGDHLMFVAGTANAALDPVVAIPRLQAVIPHAKMLYLGGCFKLKAFEAAFKEVTELAAQYDAKLAVDHGRMPEGVSNGMLAAVKNLVLGAAYYFPSRDEFCKLWEVADIEAGLHLLHEKAPKLTVVVKDGGQGAHYVEGASIQHAPAAKVDKIQNATGAGDSFNAGVITALLKGQPLAAAVAYGSRVAAAKISGQAPEVTDQ